MAQFLIGRDPVPQQRTVGTSRVKIPETPLPGGESRLIKNFAGQTCFVGDSTVTKDNGFPLEVGETLPFAIASQANIYGITESGEADIRILEAV